MILSFVILCVDRQLTWNEHFKVESGNSSNRSGRGFGSVCRGNDSRRDDFNHLRDAA